MELKQLKRVHLIGVGGINMSAVAKLLLANGVKVSGSDVAENEQTTRLAERGAIIKIGEAAEHIPEGCELVITTSAAPITNKERMAAAERKIPELTNFAFLGRWFSDAQTVVIAGTHGKSRTTAMLGLMLEKAGKDPTVIVGSKVPSFPDGNLRLGRSDLFVVEGDEYAKHFLEFRPHAVILNNLELDHTDTFPTINAMLEAFHELVGQVKDGGIVVVNTADERLARLIETERESLVARGITVIPFGAGEHAWKVESAQQEAARPVTMTRGSETMTFTISVPGAFNAMNAAGAALMAQSLGATHEDIAAALSGFSGIWRRFEYLATTRGAPVYSDYGHHPTAVAATLRAAQETFPNDRIVLCFQPHHRNRTRALFLDFVTSFDLAEALILCEIYEVSGRDEDADKHISSRDLVDAVMRHDADRGVKRPLEYAPDPAAAVRRTLELVESTDVVIFMGAGDIDGEVRKVVKP
ncbi:UDP-N-acetylmuramate--L-alanine ligase [Candidatus Uhrbacteria bacterium]|nr:UDP-N-acetylmuramate--L-alanine ligase [Candidatus Uhrbacteria bacterium]